MPKGDNSNKRKSTGGAKKLLWAAATAAAAAAATQTADALNTPTPGLRGTTPGDSRQTLHTPESNRYDVVESQNPAITFSYYGKQHGVNNLSTEGASSGTIEINGQSFQYTRKSSSTQNNVILGLTLPGESESMETGILSVFKTPDGRYIINGHIKEANGQYIQIANNRVTAIPAYLIDLTRKHLPVKFGDSDNHRGLQQGTTSLGPNNEEQAINFKIKFCYSDAVLQQCDGDVNALQASFELIIASMNQVMQNSGLNVTFSGSLGSNFNPTGVDPHTGANFAIKLQGGIGAESPDVGNTFNPFAKFVNANIRQADDEVIVFVGDIDEFGTGVAGVAYEDCANQFPVQSSMRQCMFMAISYQEALSSARDASHEIGHIFGLQHDPKNVGSSPGRFVNAYGVLVPTIAELLYQGTVGSMMSYVQNTIPAYSGVQIGPMVVGGSQIPAGYQLGGPGADTIANGQMVLKMTTAFLRNALDDTTTQGRVLLFDNTVGGNTLATTGHPTTHGTSSTTSPSKAVTHTPTTASSTTSPSKAVTHTPTTASSTTSPSKPVTHTPTQASSTTSPSKPVTPTPTKASSTSPSVAPSKAPSEAPSVASSEAPSTSPSVAPSTAPSVAPTGYIDIFHVNAVSTFFANVGNSESNCVTIALSDVNFAEQTINNAFTFNLTTTAGEEYAIDVPSNSLSAGDTIEVRFTGGPYAFISIISNQTAPNSFNGAPSPILKEVISVQSPSGYFFDGGLKILSGLDLQITPKEAAVSYLATAGQMGVTGFPLPQPPGFDINAAKLAGIAIGGVVASCCAIGYLCMCVFAGGVAVNRLISRSSTNTPTRETQGDIAVVATQPVPVEPNPPDPSASHKRGSPGRPGG